METSHVLPALLRKIHEANASGEEHLNVGVGHDISIRELAELIADIVGCDGGFTYDTSMPDGTPRKPLDVTRLRQLGWEPSISLREGIRHTYDWYVEHEC